MTGDYQARAAELVKGSLGHSWKVTIDPVGTPAFPLECDDVEVTFAEDWSPHVQARITGAIPSDLAKLDSMDARLNCRVIIDAGYRYADGTLDVHPLADVGLRNRRTSRPSNQMSLTASSDEARAQDRRRAFYGGPFTDFAGINEAVAWFADYAVYPESAVIDSAFSDTAYAGAVDGLDVPVGTDMWGPIEDAAARAGVWVYCTGARTWKIAARPSLGGTVRHSLTVGKDSTIFAADTEVDRQDFANHSVVEYTWEDAEGKTQKIYGRAAVTSGPFSVNVVGYVTDHKRYERSATQAQADQAAATRVQGLVSRGRGLTLEAHAAYWLRPGHTINVQLPTGPAENHLIKSITFQRKTGKMTINTRQPMDVTITTGE